MVKKQLFMVLILIYFFFSLSANTDQFRFEIISSEHGLSQNSVSAIFQDRDGFLWFGTQDGLNKYDGYDFTVYRYDPDNSNSLCSNTVRVILEDSTGILWLGTAGGVSSYNPDTNSFQRYQHNPDKENSLSKNLVTSICEEDDRFLWIGTTLGLNKFDKKEKKFTRFFHNPHDSGSLIQSAVIAVFIDRFDTLWVGTVSGLDRYDKNTNRFIHYRANNNDPHSLQSNRISCIYEDSSGTLWIGTIEGGLHRYDRQKNSFINYQSDLDDVSSLSNNNISSVMEDKSGRIWITTFGGGLNLFDPETERIIRYNKYSSDSNNILHCDAILTIYQDRSGIIWLGTEYQGIIKMTQKKFSHHFANSNTFEYDLKNTIQSFTEDSTGKIWVGTPMGLRQFDPEKKAENHNFKQKYDFKRLLNEDIQAIHEDTSGRLWFGTRRHGLYSFDLVTQRISHFNRGRDYPFGLSNTFVRVIYEDKQGEIWVGTQSGLNRFDSKCQKFHYYFPDQKNTKSISGNNITTIHGSGPGHIWVGTFDNGLNRFNKKTGEFIHYNHDPGDPQSLSENTIQYVYEDSTGTLWIGTASGGLNRFNSGDDTFTRFGIAEGLPSNCVYAILEDQSGNLWISTTNGLCRFNPRINEIINYNIHDGLQHNEFNFNAFLKSRKGEIFFGGLNGFNVFFPEIIKVNSFIPPIRITDFYKFNKKFNLEIDISELESLKLSYRDDIFSFKFTALDYTNPQKNRYAYKMDGFEDEWVYTDFRRRFAQYTNLPPGQYSFKVRGSNSDGVWNEQEVHLKVVISPPFWVTWWFKTMVIVFFTLILFLLYKRRVRTIEQDRNQLEHQVKEKTEAANALKSALSEVEKLKNRLQAENIYLKDEIKLDHNFADIISRSESLKKVLRNVEMVASTDSTVLILGESGTGKELLARAIHNLSNRKERPLVKVDCATLPPNLIESELFGHEKGAFTGAISKKNGRFELADRGTIFLDEIGELPSDLQIKLLRILQDGEFERLGNPRTFKVDVRIIAATNRKLEQEVKNGNFREDLYYRLNVFPLTIPPLRERKEDIPLLVKHFLNKYSIKTGKKIEKIPQSTIDILQEYSWPGNIRELENVIERAIILTKGNKLQLDNWFSRDASQVVESQIPTLEDNEKNLILKVLKKTGWRVSGEKGAARILGLNPQTLISRMKKLGIERGK